MGIVPCDLLRSLRAFDVAMAAPTCRGRSTSARATVDNLRVDLSTVAHASVDKRERRLNLDFASWNQIGKWLRRVEALRYAA